MIVGEFRRWLNNLSRNTRGRAAGRKRARSARPRLEVLEGREVPATLFVDNPGDFTITSDNGTVGVLDNNDVVTWTPGAGSGPVENLIFGTDAFTSIQAGINAATAGDTVLVGSGTFVEQLEISKTLDVIEAEGHNAVIKSPASLPLGFTTNYNNASNKAVIYVHDASDVTLRGLTVDGDGQGNSNYRFVGIAYHNAGGTIDGVEVKNITDTPFSGMQGGLGILGYVNNAASPHPLTVKDSLVHDYQKNGITMIGAGLTAHVTGNTVTGAGPTDKIAQNGIQFSLGATGTITGNRVSGHQYTGVQNADSTGILLYGGSAAVDNNHITANDDGIHVTNGGSLTSVTENFVTGNTGDGIHVTDTAGSVAPVSNNDLSGNGGLAVNNQSATMVDAAGNWWGTSTAAGVAAEISGNVDYSPFLLTGGDTSAESGFQPALGEGNVRVKVVGGRLMIIGDKLDNQIIVEKGSTPFSYRVIGLAGTQINGQSGSFDFTNVTRGIDADLRRGDDQLVLDGSVSPFTVLGTIKVRTGRGDDLVQLQGVTTAKADLGSSWGRDSVQLIDSDFRKLAVDWRGNGASTSLLLDDVTVTGRTDVRGGKGADTVRAVDSTFASLFILTGDGSDTVRLENVDATGGVHVRTGRHADVVAVSDSSFDAVVLGGGLGNDNLDAGTESNTKGNTFVDDPVISGFEVILP